MNANRVAAIRDMAWSSEAVYSDNVLELCDHIKTLEAENERRKANENVLRARVIELETVLVTIKDVSRNVALAARTVCDGIERLQ